MVMSLCNLLNESSWINLKQDNFSIKEKNDEIGELKIKWH